MKVSTDDVVITGIQSEVDDTTYTSGQEGYMLKLDNQLITGNEQDAVNRIGRLLIGLKFRPFEMDHVAYPFAEFGDLCYVTDRKNNVYQSVITDVDFQFYGYTTIKCTAESPIRNSSAYYSGDDQKRLLRPEEKRRYSSTNTTRPFRCSPALSRRALAYTKQKKCWRMAPQSSTCTINLHWQHPAQSGK